MNDIEDIGSYWYDDPKTKTNGEFDCVVKRAGNLYDFYECKYYKNPMKEKECRDEEKQIRDIKGISASGIGFICTGGFAFEDTGECTLIEGEALYK